ncbi:VOC family protein [Streptacidiphilus cavernicola]|uniref:VOC family protein n=1 Tax=Streptacidiphilus cavernicola TaxID=3342716 RepID=A0ABV6VZL3_9ACTN
MISSTFRPGSPIWLDLGTTDLDASTAFYTGLFGWTIASTGPHTGRHGFFEQDGKTVAGFGPVMEPGVFSGWTPFFGSTNVEATAKSVEQAGGTVRMPATDVRDSGRMAQFTDPTGGRFAAWQPGRNTGFGVVNVPGSVSWVELHTTDGPAALRFYRQALGWVVRDMPIGGEMLYHVLSPADSDGSDGFGGIMAMAEFPAVLWRPYFEVADCDASLAKGVALGATAMMAAETMPGVGRMAELVDPQGSRFAIIATEGQPG